VRLQEPGSEPAPALFGREPGRELGEGTGHLEWVCPSGLRSATGVLADGKSNSLPVNDTERARSVEEHTVISMIGMGSGSCRRLAVPRGRC
jgi:hypothetical protein